MSENLLNVWHVLAAILAGIVLGVIVGFMLYRED